MKKYSYPAKIFTLLCLFIFMHYCVAFAKNIPSKKTSFKQVKTTLAKIPKKKDIYEYTIKEETVGFSEKLPKIVKTPSNELSKIEKELEKLSLELATIQKVREKIIDEINIQRETTRKSTPAKKIKEKCPKKKELQDYRRKKISEFLTKYKSLKYLK